MNKRDNLVLILQASGLIFLATVSTTKADPPAPSAPPPAAPADPAPAPGTLQTPKDAGIPLGMIMQQNGGSLFRAEMDYHAASPADQSHDGDKPAAPVRSIQSVSFFSVADPKPKSFKKHDLVTIIAKENSAFTSNGNATQTKTEDLDSKLNAFIALRPSTMQLHSIISGGSNVPEINFANSRDFKGQGEVDRTDTFSDRVTAEVVDVKPNGTLVVEAIKHIKTDEEDQRMILTGTCRAEDITADNTVLTTQLFDLELTQTHTGAVNDSTSRGLIPRLLDTFSPF
jgi:flagellar L-ring protein precursor FlgH